jgi:transcriptional regulator with XRE-family HTH domain
MSTRLRAARLARGWTQQRVVAEVSRLAAGRHEPIANRASLKTLLSRWENGRQVPDAVYQRLLREVFGLDDAELGFHQPADSAEVVTAEQQLCVDLARADHVDEEAIALTRTQLETLRRLDRRMGAPTLLEQTRSLIITLTGWLTNCVVPTRRTQIAGVLADAAALAGWQSLDLGATAQAYQHFEVAKAAAREAEDPAVLAWASAEQAYVLLDLGRRGDAQHLMQHQRERFDRKVPRVLGSWLAAAEAECAAANADAASCHRALDSATAMLPLATEEAAPPYVALDALHLARWRGHVLARLGDNDALCELSRAAVAIDPGFSRARAGLHTDLAIAFDRIGEQTERNRHARIAAELARQIGSVRQRQRLLTLDFRAATHQVVEQAY